MRAVVAAVTAMIAAMSLAIRAGAETGASNGRFYSVAMTSIDGATRSAAQEQVDKVKAQSNAGEQWKFESNGHVRFRSIAVAELILGTHYYGAHPTPYVSTVVIDSRNAEPIALTDLLIDSQSALNRLSSLTGAEPVVENFANWVPSAEGLEIHFVPYQFGIALPETKIIPWAALADLITPAMAGITQS
jgi:hypothetical protein